MSLKCLVLRWGRFVRISAPPSCSWLEQRQVFSWLLSNALNCCTTKPASNSSTVEITIKTLLSFNLENAKKCDKIFVKGLSTRQEVWFAKLFASKRMANCNCTFVFSYWIMKRNFAGGRYVMHSRNLSITLCVSKALRTPSPTSSFWR